MDCALTALALFISHILTDFYFQPNSWVRAKEQKKQKAWQLYAHSLIAGVFALLLVWAFNNQFIWWLIPAVTLPHLLIDLWKLIYGKRMNDFFIDQGLHVAHLVVILALLTDQPFVIEKELLLQLIIPLTGALFLTLPSGITIGKITEKFRANLSSKDKRKALPEAGKWIGILERLFIFIAIMVGQFSAIGFLIAAKSILRFSDSRTVENPIRMSEYVLIGSLLSFLFAIITALLCQFLLNNI